MTARRAHGVARDPSVKRNSIITYSHEATGMKRNVCFLHNAVRVKSPIASGNRANRTESMSPEPNHVRAT